MGNKQTKTKTQKQEQSLSFKSSCWMRKDVLDCPESLWCEFKARSSSSPFPLCLVREGKLQSLDFVSVVDAVMHLPDCLSGMTALLSQLLGMRLAESPSIPYGVHLCSRELLAKIHMPFQTSSHPGTDESGNIKAQSPWPRLGQVWRVVSASELPLRWAEASNETESQVDFSLCAVLPSLPFHRSWNFLRAQLRLSICFIGNPPVALFLCSRRLVRSKVRERKGPVYIYIYI